MLCIHLTIFDKKFQKKLNFFKDLVWKIQIFLLNQNVEWKFFDSYDNWKLEIQKKSNQKAKKTDTKIVPREKGIIREKNK